MNFAGGAHTNRISSPVSGRPLCPSLSLISSPEASDSTHNATGPLQRAERKSAWLFTRSSLPSRTNQREVTACSALVLNMVPIICLVQPDCSLFSSQLSQNRQSGFLQDLGSLGKNRKHRTHIELLLDVYQSCTEILLREQDGSQEISKHPNHEEQTSVDITLMHLDVTCHQSYSYTNSHPVI